MEELFWARSQMAFSLGFHIIFACIGMVMPVLMATAEALYLSTRRPVYLRLAQAWAKGVAIFFAVGAVSGTVLSFELGLLFPTFMERFGPVIGLPFAWEGTAFFLEAIFLGLWLYGWKHLSGPVHWLCGIGVAVSGMLSGVFVLSANGFMNAPTGFEVDANGRVTSFDVVEAMFNEAWAVEAVHMVWAAVIATGFAVAGVHAWRILRVRRRAAQRFHRAGLAISLSYGAAFALTMPVTGDFLAKHVAQAQPIKLAAMEAHFDDEVGAPIILGGIPDVKNGRVDYAIKVPGVLSFLAYGDFDATVRGLNSFPRELWPPVTVCHVAFQVMVGAGFWLTLLGAIAVAVAWRRRRRGPRHRAWRKLERALLWAIVLSTPLGFVSVEAGWTVTEVGRQPWIVYGVLKTADAVTVMPGLAFSFFATMAVYGFLLAVAGLLLIRHIHVAESAAPVAPAASSTAVSSEEAL